MFSIYGVSGQMFKGPLEEMRRVGPALRSARIRAVQGRLAGTDEPEYLAAPVVAREGAATGGGFHQQALNEYARVQSPVPERHPLSRVADVMNDQAVLIVDTATVGEGWQLLASQGVGQAPVVNADGRLVGLLARADLLRPDRLPGPDTPALAWRALLMSPVTEVMVTPVPSVDAQTDIRRVAQVLLDTGLPGLPVVDEAGQVSGFVSRSDILRAVVHDPPLDLWS